ncbi:MAG: PhnD/SsuA/transferrin family substrate-binding protein [Gammaproteobacteria bacterium]|nr:PhnD/SsuA/transferrin family substrate-binding protein [Gammaproteobacteria bacterium]
MTTMNRLMVVGILVTLLFACVAPVVLANDSTDSGIDSKTVYKFGVTPWQQGQSIDDIRRLFKPMLSYLADEIDANFIIVGARDYNHMVELLSSESIHLAAISPVPFVLAKRINPSVKYDID